MTKLFDKIGSNLTADGSNDHMLKLQGHDDAIVITTRDATRDAKTGELPEVRSELVLDHQAGVDEEGSEGEELTENDASDADESDGGTTDEAPTGPYDLEFQTQVACPTNLAKSLLGRKIAYQWDCGWNPGEVKRVSRGATTKGQFVVYYEDDLKEHMHELFEDDYGTSADHRWVLIKVD